MPEQQREMLFQWETTRLQAESDQLRWVEE